MEDNYTNYIISGSNNYNYNNTLLNNYTGLLSTNLNPIVESTTPLWMEESQIQQEQAIYFAFITNGILLNVVAILGVFGNIISMIILSRPQMKSSINYLLIGLAR